MDAPLKKRLWPLLYTGLAAALAYAGFTLWSGAEEAVAAARRLGLGGGALVLSLSLLNYALRLSRWQGYLVRLGYPVPVRANLRYFLASFAFTATPGKLGEAVRSLYLKPHGVPYPESLSALFVERLLDLAATLLFAAVGVLYFGRYAPFVAVPVGGVVLILLLLGNARLRAWLRALWAGRGAGVLDALGAASVLSRGWPLALGLALSLLGWGAEALAFHLTLHLIGLELPFAASLGIYGLAITVGALSFLPGGLGGTEAVMILLLTLSGVSAADAGAATILLRLATLWFAVLLGVGVALSLGRRGAPARRDAAALSDRH